MEQHKRWRITRTILGRAYNALPVPKSDEKVEFDNLTHNYREYLEHNEFELALDMLEELGDLVPCRGGFWKDLERAAESMELYRRIPYFKQQFSAALDRLKEK